INNYTYEFVMNMPEIKINNAQNSRIDKWVFIQNKIIGLELKSLFLNMYQLTGANFLSRIKEVFVVGICVYFILENQLSLGAMFGITYIIGQLSGPISNLVSFIKDAQEAYIANKRIELIYDSKDENDGIAPNALTKDDINIAIKDLTFKYPGKHCAPVLKNISINIPANSITAIVGASGSGKTTLMKLLLSYYNVDSGSILLNDVNLKKIIPEDWRKNCGIVLQDGNIFSGTLAENISFSEDEFDLDKLNKAARIANLKEFVDQLPMGYHTKVGKSGMSMSGGQMQRLLIARAIYRNPKFIFLDEASSALDAENEKIIHDNLQEFFKGKTVIIIAHRLSTVKNADQIIVLDKGNLTEIGSHADLVKKKGNYYSLVKNQLELGEE
ncbi:MAG TPA: ATP-binding cassette domain-containing protein, partial [Bacteroidia bacterium]|nr:ATP-binding cassette domain-containing protein [Bacteroidia bacterium]